MVCHRFGVAVLTVAVFVCRRFDHTSTRLRFHYLSTPIDIGVLRRYETISCLGVHQHGSLSHYIITARPAWSYNQCEKTKLTSYRI